MLSRVLVLFPFFAMAMSVSSFKTDLTKVTWAHAVNNDSLLTEALMSDVDMIEADISLGKLNPNDTKDIPIMAHPPEKISDLSLKDFLISVNDHNRNHTDARKGVKLDFKSIDAFTASVTVMKEHLKGLNPVWLNADILQGPVNASAVPVNPKTFITTCEKEKEFSNITLSIGWTTYYNSSYKGLGYEMDMIEEMITTVKSLSTKHEITFPVRATFAAESLTEMKNLLVNVSGSTLTIWSSEDDTVNEKKLRSLILDKDVGVNKVYLDVPQELRDKLDLPSAGSRVASFGLLTALSFLLLNKII